MKQRKVIFLIASFLLNIFLFSCTWHMNAVYTINFQDENGQSIDSFIEISRFKLTKIESSKNTSYRSFKVERRERQNNENKKYYEYELIFSVGPAGTTCRANTLIAGFLQDIRYTGVKIEDEQGEYKSIYVYPLSAYSEDVAIIVKLEKKE